MAHVDAEVRSLKWKLWHGQTNRALEQLETMTSDLAKLREGNISAVRLLHLGHPLPTYVRSSKSANRLRRPLSIRPAHRDGVG